MLPKDPFMLLSAINMKLRDGSDSLEEICLSEGVDVNEVISKLKDAGFEYLPEINQFR